MGFLKAIYQVRLNETSFQFLMNFESSILQSTSMKEAILGNFGPQCTNVLSRENKTGILP